MTSQLSKHFLELYRSHSHDSGHIGCLRKSLSKDSKPVVVNLWHSRCSWTTIPISPCQHGSKLMALFYYCTFSLTDKEKKLEAFFLILVVLYRSKYIQMTQNFLT
uniref:Uncharacterized protein n=1 Tax=Sphaerodactylus townsendi TaxID=933632 RepID=A0ACB8G0G6_9SAUR